MTTQELMQKLESLGSEQTRKTYRRHGAKDPLFGVSYAEFYKLQKRIKVNHSLAQELWATGNYDARILALLIANPNEATEAELIAWIADIDNYPLASQLGDFISQTPLAQQIIADWTPIEEEWQGRAGWVALSCLTRSKQPLPDEFYAGYLPLIERDIRQKKNRIRDAMYSALMAIGISREALREQAIEIAGRIGKVEIDHGDTNCKTPDAATYIRQSVAKLEARKNKAK